MTFIRSMTFAAAAAAAASLSAPAIGQRPPPSPEQRLERLERQIDQVQRQVFPRGRPADTSGVAFEPAATQSSVVTLNQRIDALERQMVDILRQSEENGHRLQTLEGSFNRSQSAQEQRLTDIERRLNEAATAQAVAQEPLVQEPSTTRPTQPRPARNEPRATTTPTPTPVRDTSSTPAGGAPATDPGEDAYTEGFKLWEGGNYDQAITSLRAFASAYPRHRRTSYARNLVGRALLDKGEPRAAAEALLANYRANPGGERAADSLYYLGQALMQLGQPGQACKAYSELEAVYGAKVRADLKSQVTAAKQKANCS